MNDQNDQSDDNASDDYRSQKKMSSHLIHAKQLKLKRAKL